MSSPGCLAGKRSFRNTASSLPPAHTGTAHCTPLWGRQKSPRFTNAGILGKMKMKAFHALVLVFFSPRCLPPTALRHLKSLGLPRPPAAHQNGCGASSSMGGTSYAWDFPGVVVTGHRLLFFSKLCAQVPWGCWATCFLIPVSIIAVLFLLAFFIKAFI